MSFGVFDPQSGKAVPSYLTSKDVQKKKKMGTKSLLQVRANPHERRECVCMCVCVCVYVCLC